MKLDKSKLYILYAFLLITNFLHAQTDTTLFFENADIRYEYRYESFENAWYVSSGIATLDTLSANGKNSLLLSPSQSNSQNQINIGYYINFDNIDADTITFSGKYRYVGNKNAKLAFCVEQCYMIATNNHRTVEEADVSAINQSSWFEFSIKTSVRDNIHGIMLYIESAGDAKLWLNDCIVKLNNRPLSEYVNIHYKEKDDHEFDESSRIKLGALTPAMAENLEVLGKVWGFLKYYHPEVVTGNYNWDYELFRILPEIAYAKNKQERNSIFKQWLKKYGNITESLDYTIKNDTIYSRTINLDWLNDKEIFDDEMIENLNSIKNAKRSKVNYYVKRLRDPNDPNDRERRYHDISWEDQGFRLLNLFKLWNAIEYCSPYVDLTDKTWKSLLKIYIPRFAEPISKTDYEQSLLEFFANINDSHGMLHIPGSELLYANSVSLFGEYWTPVFLSISEDEKIVVKQSYIEELKAGDIIVDVEGRNIDEIMDEFARYVPASDKYALFGRIKYSILKTKKDKLPVTFIRLGEQLSTILSYDTTNFENDILSPNFSSKYDMKAKNIGYLDISTIKDDEIINFLTEYIYAKGLIIDMRTNGGSYYVNSVLQSFLPAKRETYNWNSINDGKIPGNYKFEEKYETGLNNPELYFKGKVAILVDEGVISSKELRTMAYRKAPNSKVIGGTTSGTIGGISHFHLAGNIYVRFTADGSYYPNWEQVQRKGVNIDILIRPSAKDLKEERDVVIERAISYIMND